MGKKRRLKMHYKKSAIRRGRHLTPRTIKMKIRQTHWYIGGFWVSGHFWQRFSKRYGVYGLVESIAALCKILSGELSVQPKISEPGKYEYRNGEFVFVVEEICGMKVINTFYISKTLCPKAEE